MYSLSRQGRPLWRLWTSVRISPAASKFLLISPIQKQQQTTTTTTTTKILAWLSNQTPTQKQTPRPVMRLGCVYTCQVDKCARVSFKLYMKETSLEDHGECLTTSQLSEDGQKLGLQHRLLQTSGLCPLCLFTPLFLFCSWEVLWEVSQDPGALSLSNASNKQQPGTIFFQRESKPGTINSCSLYSGWQLPLPHSSWPRAVKAKGFT